MSGFKETFRLVLVVRDQKGEKVRQSVGEFEADYSSKRKEFNEKNILSKFIRL